MEPVCRTWTVARSLSEPEAFELICERHGQALAGEIPGARLLPLEAVGRGVQRIDWDTITQAIATHPTHNFLGFAYQRSTARPIHRPGACGSRRFYVVKGVSVSRAGVGRSGGRARADDGPVSSAIG
jgi:hypothetical protein